MVAPQPTTAQQIYDPENEGAWDGQLPHADLVDQLPPPIERKPGGPLERDEWRRSNAARVGHAAYKLLDVLSGYSNPEGRCWPGMDSLTKVTGMSERVIYRGFLELRVKAIAWLTYPGKPVCKSNPYHKRTSGKALCGASDKCLTPSGGGPWAAPPHLWCGGFSSILAKWFQAYSESKRPTM